MVVSNEVELDALLAKYPGYYFKENCTFANPTILAFSGGLPCSGNGECTPQGLCICDPGYRGVGDLFDLQGISCHNNILADQIAWLIMGFCSFMVVVFYCRAIYLKTDTLLSKLRRDGGGKVPFGGFVAAAVRYFPYKVLFPYCCIGAPAFIGLAIVRSFTTDMSIGNNFIPTLLLLLGSFPGFFSQQENSLAEFNSVAKGSLLRSEQGKKAKRMYKRIVRGGELFYTIGKIPLLVFLTIPDKPFNPIVYPMIVINNLAVAIYLIFFAVGANTVYDKLRAMRQTMKDSGLGNNSTMKSDSGVTASSSIARRGIKRSKVSTQRLDQVLLLMHETNDAARKTGTIAGLLYVVFSLPWFAPYQGFMYAVSLTLSAKPNITLAKTFSAGTQTNQSTRGAFGTTTEMRYTKEKAATSFTDSQMKVDTSAALIHNPEEERETTETFSAAEFLEIDSDDEDGALVPDSAGIPLSVRDIIDDTT